MFLRRLAAPTLLLLISFASSGCRVGKCHSPSQCDHKFSCESNDDCIAPNRCVAGVCGTDGIECMDADEDGYGVGDTSDCPQCVGFGECEQDCNDDDPFVSPGLNEICDGVDNDCDGEIDEPTGCEDSADCPEEQPYIVRCDAGTCVYQAPLQTDPDCAGSLACVAAAREQRPDSCF